MFSYSTNRIIGGICEYCGIKATECEHYKDGKSKPLDYKEALTLPGNVPVYKNIAVEPLKEEEKVETLAEAEAIMNTYVESEVLSELPVEETI